jgi:hypothetical protein
MDATETFQFLKPVLDQFNDQERKDLINFISEYLENKRVDAVMEDIPEMNSMLFKTEPFIPSFEIVPFIPTFQIITKK